MKAIIIVGLAAFIGVIAFLPGAGKGKIAESDAALPIGTAVSQPQLLPADIYNPSANSVHSSAASRNIEARPSLRNQVSQPARRNSPQVQQHEEASTDSYCAQMLNYQPSPRQISYASGAAAPGALARRAVIPAPHANLEQVLEQVDRHWQPSVQNSYPQNAVQSAQPGFNPLFRQAMPQQNAAPDDPRQNLLRMFMGGGSSPANPNRNASGRSSSSDGSTVGQAQSLLQQAADQASQAESDAERASSGDDRQGAASSAQYHASAARQAADTAYSIAGGSSSDAANNYAAQAKDAADRAQAAADRASYNASM